MGSLANECTKLNSIKMEKRKNKESRIHAYMAYDRRDLKLKVDVQSSVVMMVIQKKRWHVSPCTPNNTVSEPFSRMLRLNNRGIPKFVTIPERGSVTD